MLLSMPAYFSFTPHVLGGRLPADARSVNRRRDDQKPGATNSGVTHFFCHSRYGSGFDDVSGGQKAAVV
jgi:hypothetical protein